MTIRFTARSTGVARDFDDRHLSAGIAEHEDGGGFAVILSCRGPRESGCSTRVTMIAESGTVRRLTG
jgi:hypothetical protein